MSELKCSPFCGGEAKYMEIKDFIISRFVTCTKCGIETQRNCLNRKDAIKRWNTRTPMANIVEKLEKLPCGRSYHDYAEKGIVHKYLERNDVLDIVKQEINNGLE